jgi:hypothetical protein
MMDPISAHWFKYYPTAHATVSYGQDSGSLVYSSIPWDMDQIRRIGLRGYKDIPSNQHV